MLTQSHAEGQSGMKIKWISEVYRHNQARPPDISLETVGKQDYMNFLKLTIDIFILFLLIIQLLNKTLCNEMVKRIRLGNRLIAFITLWSVYLNTQLVTWSTWQQAWLHLCKVILTKKQNICNKSKYELKDTIGVFTRNSLVWTTFGFDRFCHHLGYQAWCYSFTWKTKGELFWKTQLKDKYPNFEVGLKCIIMVF